jgi:hypothetical protein
VFVCRLLAPYYQADSGMKYIDGKAQTQQEPLEIEKGIPAPPPLRTSASPCTIAARSMEIGDSVAMPYTRDVSYTSRMARATGFTFTQRRDGDKVRIWRIA